MRIYLTFLKPGVFVFIQVSTYITTPLSPVTHAGAVERPGEQRRPHVCRLSVHVHEPTPPVCHSGRSFVCLALLHQRESQESQVAFL